MRGRLAGSRPSQGTGWLGWLGLAARERSAQRRALPPQSVPEELQSGAQFGYVVRLRPAGSAAWTERRVPAAESSRFVYRNESLAPLSPFEVQVGAYNAEGDGARSAVATVYSGEDGEWRPARPAASPGAAALSAAPSPSGRRAPAGPARRGGAEPFRVGGGGVLGRRGLGRQHGPRAGL